MNIKSIFLSICLITTAKALTLKCESFFHGTTWHEETYECGCFTLNIFDKNDRTITEITGENEREITSIWINASPVHYFPKDLENFFSDLIGIGITRTGLKEITSEDLKPFPNLVFLSFLDNDLEVIENKLFIHNPLLKEIELHHNKITTVAANAFINLNQLSILHFLSNVCHSENADGLSNVIILISNILDNCYQNPTTASTTTMEPIKVECASKQLELSQKNDENYELKLQIDTLTQKSSKLQAEMKTMENWIWFLIFLSVGLLLAVFLSLFLRNNIPHVLLKN